MALPVMNGNPGFVDRYLWSFMSREWTLKFCFRLCRLPLSAASVQGWERAPACLLSQEISIYSQVSQTAQRRPDDQGEGVNLA